MNDSSPEYLTTEIVTEEVIRLLEERLLINRSKRKVGEVIVRKVVETQIVEVPVRREKLIVEQVSPEHKQLVEIDLGQGDITGVELTQVASLDTQPTVSGEFISPKAASSLLDALARQHHLGYPKVRVEVVLENAAHQATYQGWFDRCSSNQAQTLSLLPNQ